MADIKKKKKKKKKWSGPDPVSKSGPCVEVPQQSVDYKC